MMSSLFDNKPVLLQIIGLLDIPTILNLRRTCKSTHGLISGYEYSIARTAEASAWHDKIDDGVNYLSVSSLSDLIRLNIARQLAVQLVASRQSMFFHDIDYCAGIAPDDLLGNEMRDCVTRGLMLVYKLHELYAGSGSTTTVAKDTLFNSVKGFLKGQVTQSQNVDITALHKKWSPYASTLAADDFIALILVHRVMMGRIMYEGRLNESCGGSPLWLYVKADGEYLAIEWLMGYMLLQGPIFVKKFWSQDQRVRDPVYQSLISTCKKRTAKMIAREQGTICSIHGSWFENVCSLARPQTRDIPTEARAFYISIYFSRRGLLPAEMSWEERLRIRQFDVGQWEGTWPGCRMAAGEPKKWMKAKHRSRRKPEVYSSQRSQDLP